MTILDRVKQRTETDIADDELQRMIDEANQDVVAKFGPHVDPGKPITVELEGHRHTLVLDRPIDTTQPVEITEYVTEYGFGETTYICAPLDYRIWEGGSVIERLSSGAWSRYRWPDRVKITYVPVNDGDQRAEVIIKLVLLTLQYEGVSTHTVGDISENNLDYESERRKLLSSLAPRSGLYMA